MPYVPIPKDMSAVKTKVVGPLTARQAVCFGVGAVIGVPLFLAAKGSIGVEPAALLMIAIMLPAFFMGIYEKDSLPPEKHIQYAIETHITRATERPYETINIFDLLKKQENYRKEAERILQESMGGTGAATGTGKIRIGPNDKLDRRTKRELDRAMKKAKRDGKVPHSAQETIPYKIPHPDGIFEVEDGYFSRTIQFYDINYSLLNNDDKNSIFEHWCDFLNYFDASIHFQLSFYDQEVNKAILEKNIVIKDYPDDFSAIRREYANYLKAQLAKGNNGLIKEKYLTIGIHADDYKQAKPRLEKITLDVVNNLIRFGCKSHPLNGYERLQLLHRIFHPGSKEKLFWNWDLSTMKTGLSSKDFIAPSSFDFKDGPRLNATRYFRCGDRIGTVHYIKIMAADLPDKILTILLEMESAITVNLHIEAIEQTEALKRVKRELTDLQQMKIGEQKKAVRSGYDMDILPPELKSYEEDSGRLFEDLQKRNERLFLATITVVQMAKTKKQLDDNVFQANNLLQTYQCSLVPLDNRQEQGFVSSLPLGLNQIEIKRTLTTTSQAIFLPFTTEELFQPGGLYYGMNALSNNMIMVDRLKLKNPNGLILGRPGAGKSFSAKREIANVFFVTDDDIMILDPEGEYKYFVQQLHGQVVKVSLNSKNYINPMDINLSLHNEEDKEYDPIAEKCDFVLSFCEILLARNGNTGLEPDEVSLLDRCTNVIYNRYIQDPLPDKMPILEDLYNELLKQHGKAKETGEYLANCLEIYVKGSLSIFNHRTNVDLHNRVVCFDIKELSQKMKKLGMLIIQNQIWSAVAVNRGHKLTRVYLDEYHLLLKEKQTAAYSTEIWKRFRKWGGVPTGITQNVTDLLASREIANILDNSPFIYMLDQSASDADILADHLNISDEQLKYVRDVDTGRGLIFYGDTVIPFVDDFPKDTMLYRVMTTKPDEAMQ